VSLHADALAALEAWAAPTGAQDGLRARYAEHLRAHPDGLQRGCFPDHLTAGVLVVDAAGDRVLLNLHRKARRWFAFGGHCEPDDVTLAGAARREGLEESGLPDLRFDPVPAQLDEHAVPFCDPRGTVHHLDVRYVAAAPAGAGHAVSEESLDVRWWPVDALPELEPAMVDLVGIARDRLC
jgi:ADP-ribose pyrophosphatase YjhB (NUDIX family)